jgi:hypothetical protein
MVSVSVCVARTDSYLTYFNGSTLEAKDVQLESAKSDPRKATLVNECLEWLRSMMVDQEDFKKLKSECVAFGKQLLNCKEMGWKKETQPGGKGKAPVVTLSFGPNPRCPPCLPIAPPPLVSSSATTFACVGTKARGAWLGRRRPRSRRLAERSRRC